IDMVSISAMFTEVAELIQPQAERKKASLSLDLADDMPPIPIDAAAMHQALMNVLTNAVEAAPAKGGRITVQTRFDEGRHEAQVRVSDNGPGVPAEVRDTIFNESVTTK